MTVAIHSLQYIGPKMRAEGAEQQVRRPGESRSRRGGVSATGRTGAMSAITVGLTRFGPLGSGADGPGGQPARRIPPPG